VNVVWTVILFLCCDYIVDEFAIIFCIFSKFFALKLLIFGGLPWPPKIRTLFLAGLDFRRPGGEPPKVNYFRRPGSSRRK
jgi:hypothetical protein